MADWEPTNVKLSEAVKMVLTEDPDTPYKEVKTKILETNPEWKLADRRVKKFVKRHNGAGTDDDTTVSDLSGSASKTVAVIKRIFSPRSKVKAEPIPDPLSPVAEPEPVIKQTIEVTLDGVYADDKNSENDKCECNACVIS